MNPGNGVTGPLLTHRKMIQEDPVKIICRYLARPGHAEGVDLEVPLWEGQCRGDRWCWRNRKDDGVNDLQIDA